MLVKGRGEKILWLFWSEPLKYAQASERVPAEWLVGTDTPRYSWGASGEECSEYHEQRQQYAPRTVLGNHTTSCQILWAFKVETGRDDRFPTRLAHPVGQINNLLHLRARVNTHANI